MRIVLVGAPGAGKGTQGQRIAELLHVPRIAVGEWGTDAFVTGLVARELELHPGGFVLDGFPSTAEQARELDRYLRAHAATIDAVLHFELPDAIAIERAASRTGADGRPSGADTRLAQERLAEFRTTEEELLEYYRGRIVEVDATGDVESVFDRVLDGLREAVLAA